MAEMQRRMEQWDHSFTMAVPGVDLKGGVLPPGSSGAIVENDRSTKWSVDQDGRIKVTVKDGADAKEETFEAKDMEELKKDHPEIAKRLGGVLGQGRAFVWRSGPEQRLKLFGKDLGQGGTWALRAPEPPVLGIEWTPVPDVLRDQVELPDGGIVVESVVKDSLAEKLGLQRHDVLVEVQGKAVGGTPDVRAALGEVKAGEKVTAVVVRKGLKKALETTK
jgi:membrane-associated protease RseP (regulator of RpoE activity)